MNLIFFFYWIICVVLIGTILIQNKSKQTINFTEQEIQDLLKFSPLDVLAGCLISILFVAISLGYIIEK